MRTGRWGERWACESFQDVVRPEHSSSRGGGGAIAHGAGHMPTSLRRLVLDGWNVGREGLHLNETHHIGAVFGWG